MATQYTGRYQLCQWAAEDAFLRTEFNGDNQKVDGALGKLADRATHVEEQISRQIPPLQHTVYNLLLQNYYEGKETGYKRALLFDGFQDESRIAATEAGAGYDGVTKRLKVYQQGMQSFSSPFVVAAGTSAPIHNDADKCEWIGTNEDYVRNQTFTFSSFGRLNAVTLRMGHGNYGNINTTVTILKGNTVLAVSNTVAVTTVLYEDYTLPFAGGIFLAPGEYTMRVTNVSNLYMLRVVFATSARKLGAAFDITPSNYTTGAATSRTADLGAPYLGARAWVRHIGGAVGLALRSGDGAFVDMTPMGTRQTVNLQGAPCTESSFGLTAAAASSLVTARLTLNTNGAGCAVCDYGIVFL